MSQTTARLPAIAAAALIGTWLAGCASEPSAGPAPSPITNGGARKQAAFGEARAACRMLGQFASAAEPQSEPAGSERVSVPFPDGSDLDTGTVLAYEENRLFTYVVVARSLEGGPARGDRSSGLAPELIRRILHLKPATFVIDDQVSAPAEARQVGWRLAVGREPEVSGRRVRLAGESGELIVEGLLPHEARVAVERGGPSGFRVEESAPAGHGGARLLHLLQIRDADRDREAPVAELEEAGDDVKLTIRAGEAIHRLELPAGRLGLGHIAMTEAGGRVVLGRRVLPSGVLPSGPIGARLIRRWDEEYHDGRLPPWETGRVCSELEHVMQQGQFRPGRALDLGSGTGMNAIYLAGRGFDVTAVDISPTALALAEERARQAGVRVRWVLADVTKLPDLGTFDMLFDRGCYHNVREQDLAGYVESVRRCSRPGTQFHLMAGNANEVPSYGPPRVSEADLRRELGPLFEFEWLRESHFDPPRGQPGPAPLAWSVLLRRKAAP